MNYIVLIKYYIGTFSASKPVFTVKFYVQQFIYRPTS